jgi:ubiquinone/menaquinone biosynthesis C-methylase UbiE
MLNISHGGYVFIPLLCYTSEIITAQKKVRAMSKRVKQELTTTHYAPQGRSKANLASLARKERWMTSQMGGPFPEQPNPTIFPRVLDIGCGSGSWAIDVALLYPTMSLVGIDIDPYTLNYARDEAETARVAERVEFHLMDALGKLAFPDASFDLVNLRLGSSFIRTWEWPDLLKEIKRVTRPKGVIRLAEMEPISQSSSAAFVGVGKLLASAFFHAGHFFEPEATGLTAHLACLLHHQGYQQIQTKAIRLVKQVRDADGEQCLERIIHVLPLMQPFIEKWNGDRAKEYAQLCQQILIDCQQDVNYYYQTHYLIVWGIK